MSKALFEDFGYEEVKIVGRGQYGKAHLVKGTTRDPGKSFIAKTIELTCLGKKERDAALQEVTLLGRLTHPNIVEYYHSYFATSDCLVIVMQYCEGGDVSTFIKDIGRQKKRIPEVTAMSYTAQALTALHYIHQEKILHRDLKASNLFLMRKRTVVKLGDFGISRVLEGSVEAAITVVGTPYYMSPEVCENKPYTYKSDVWSLGCVLYELCMLKHAFAADNLLGLVYKIVSEKYEPIPRMYSQALNTLLHRMLEKDVEKRMSVEDLLADPYVQSFLAEHARASRRSQTVPPRSGGGAASAAAGGAASPTTSAAARAQPMSPAATTVRGAPSARGARARADTRWGEVDLHTAFVSDVRLRKLPPAAWPARCYTPPRAARRRPNAHALARPQADAPMSTGASAAERK